MTLEDAKALRKGDLVMVVPSGWNNEDWERQWHGALAQVITWNETALCCQGLQWFCPWGTDSFNIKPKHLELVCRAEEWQEGGAR